MNPMQDLLIPQKNTLRTLKTFTPTQFRRIFRVKDTQAHEFLEKYTERGYFTRLKKGLYTLRHAHPSPFYLANQIYKPSYISFESALKFHLVMPRQAETSIHSATAKHSNDFKTPIGLFGFHMLPTAAFKGFEKTIIQDLPVKMATPEKAFADLLYYINIGKKTFPRYLNPRKLDRRKVLRYAKLFERPGLIKLAEKILTP